MSYPGHLLEVGVLPLCRGAVCGKTLIGTTTPGTTTQSGFESSGNEGVFYIPQTFWTEPLPSDCLVSYPWHLLVGEFLPLCRDAVATFNCPNWLGWQLHGGQCFELLLNNICSFISDRYLLSIFLTFKRLSDFLKKVNINWSSFVFDDLSSFHITLWHLIIVQHSWLGQWNMPAAFLQRGKTPQWVSWI